MRMMCPSSTGQNATVIIGEVTPGGTIEHLPIPLPIEIHGDEDRPLRLAGPCVEEMCGHFDDGCGLGRAVAEAVVRVRLPMTRPVCGLRPTCCWFAENGSVVCRGCSYITYGPMSFGP